MKNFYGGIARNKLFIRILLYFMSLLLPLVIVSLLFYMKIEKKLKRDFSEKIQINLQASADTIDILVNTAQEVSAAFFYDESVRSLLLPYALYTAEERARLYNIPRSLSRISTSIWYSVENVFVYADNAKVYTTGGLADYSSFFANTFHYEQYDSAFWTSRLEQSRPFEVLGPSDVHIQDYTKKRVIPIVISDVMNGHRVVMVVNISAELIRRHLHANAIFESSQHVVLDREGHIVIGADDAYKHIETASSQFLLTHRTSELYGWNYYSLTPVYELDSQLKGVFHYIVVLCLSLFVAGMLLSFLFAFKLYNPIRKIRNILADKEDVFALKEAVGTNDGNEMDYIGKGIAQLIRFSDTYKDKLDMISTEYLNTALVNLLKNNAVPNVSELERTLHTHMRFDGCDYMVCCLQITYKDAFYRELGEASPAFIHKKLKNMMYGILYNEASLYIVEMKNGLLTFIVNLNEARDRDHVLRALPLVFQPFQYDARYCDIRIGAGGAHTSLLQLHKSYNEAMTALEHGKAAEPFRMIDSAELDIRHEFYYSFTDENKIVNCLKTGDMTLLHEIAHDIIALNRGRNVSYRYVHMLLAEMYNSGQRFAAEREVPLHQLISEQEQQQLKGDDLVDLEEKRSLLLDFMQAVIDSTIDQAGGRSGEWIGEIMIYIDENYKQDLYLEKIAERFELSAKYISKIFKEKTGMNVTDYISMIRIDKAKAMIRQTDINIMHIAEDVGIFSRTTFIRLFKKYEGITPNEYRKLMR